MKRAFPPNHYFISEVLILSGYFPRIAGTVFAMPDYSPDAFRLTQAAFGNWTIADTCSNGACAPVYVIQSNVAMQ